MTLPSSTARPEPQGGHRLDALFEARSVCLVGISRNENSLIGSPLSILRRNGFDGDIYLVNPNVTEIGGLPCYASVSDLPAAPEAALVMVRAALVPSVIEELGKKGTKAAIVLSSGFEETTDGASLVQQLKEIVERYDMILVGPNCEGVWSVQNRLVLTFGSAAKRDNLKFGPIAILSQSGSIAGSIARHLQDAGYGCAYLVSAGNETTLDILDFLDYVIGRGDVRVVVLFVEGLSNGQRLCGLVEKARSKGITLVALKTGNSALGGEATTSHTGKLATSGAVYSDIFSQAGVLQVHGLVELLEAAQVLSTLPFPKPAKGMIQDADGRRGVSVLSVPGGTRALAADVCDEMGVPMAVFGKNTVARLSALLPEFGYARNPIDMTGQVLSHTEMFQAALDIVGEDPNTEAILIQLANRGPRDLEKYRDLFTDTAARLKLPIVVGLMCDTLPPGDIRALAELGVFCAREPIDAVRYLSWLYRAKENLVLSGGAVNPPLVTDLMSPATWSAWMDFLSDAGVGVPPWAVAGPHGDIEGCSAALRFPVVVKAMPTEVDHKTEGNLIRMNVGNTNEMHDAVSDIRSRLGRPDASVLVQEQIDGAQEAVVTITHNPDFGPVLAIGSGGVLVELIKDVRFLALPTTPAEIDLALDQLMLSRLIGGFRGSRSLDRASFVRAVFQFSQKVLALGTQLREIELNPLMIMPEGKGVVAVDLVVKTEASTNARPPSASG